MNEPNLDKWAALRKPFPEEAIGKLPKAGLKLDYVGHANVTDRLLSVDPTWTWEPMATDESGLPKLDSKGNLWIKLTVLGVTRIGVGDGPTAKEVVSDAIRNAAMRHGVALDLWTKDELESQLDGSDSKDKKLLPRTDLITKAQLGKLQSQFTAAGVADRSKRLGLLSQATGREIQSAQELTTLEASRIIDQMEKRLGNEPKTAITANGPEPEADKAFRDKVMDDYSTLGFNTSGKHRFFKEVTGYPFDDWYKMGDNAQAWQYARDLLDKLLNEEVKWEAKYFAGVEAES